MAKLQSVTLEEARNARGWAQTKLSRESGISIAAIRNIENDGQFKTSYGVAYALAESLGLGISDIKWPRGLSELGRPAKTGTPLVLKRTVRVTITEELVVCRHCWMQPSANGTCNCP